MRPKNYNNIVSIGRPIKCSVWVITDDDAEERSLSVRDVQVNWFEPVQIRCRPQSVLRVAGLKPLDSRRSPATAVNAKCDALQALETQMKTTCEGRQRCVIDFGAIKTIRASCRYVRYISIDVFCQPGIHPSVPKNRPLY